MARKGSALSQVCQRCGNVDDLAMVAWSRYCLPCRTCPHGRVYLTTWEPPCWQCVRDLHTVVTFLGPRIRDVEKYAQDAEGTWGLGYAEIVPHTFEEMCEVPVYGKARPVKVVLLSEPPHHVKSR